MNLSILPTTSPNFAANKLVSIKDFKGPVLKLTKSDKEKIAKLQDEIVNYDFELAKIRDILQQNEHNTQGSYYYAGLIDKIEFRISQLLSAIKDIKIARYQKQKEKFDKTNL